MFVDRVQIQERKQILSNRRLMAFERPSRAVPMSYARNWPATSVSMPATSTALICTNTSDSPPSGVKGLGTDYSFDGPHKIDTKEGRVLEAFFVSCHP
jgi:hypothetical protein